MWIFGGQFVARTRLYGASYSPATKLIAVIHSGEHCLSIAFASVHIRVI